MKVLQECACIRYASGVTAGFCVCSVGLFVFIAKGFGASLCFSYKLLLYATSCELKNYFPNHATNGGMRHINLSGKLLKFLSYNLGKLLSPSSAGNTYQNYNPSTLF